VNKISVYVLTFNEQNKIADAIKSVIDWADEVIVIDSYSTDNTADIAVELGAKVVQVPFYSFGDLRNQALKYCQYQWILSLDADERCTLMAREEILSIIKNNDTPHCAFLVPRRNYFLGQWVKYSGYYPDYRQPQLFRKGQLAYTNDLVHESYLVEGSIGKLNHPIWQIPFHNLAEILNKANRYSTLNAERLLGKKSGGLVRGFLSGGYIFIRKYVFELGFLDGRAGFMIAVGNFIGTLFKYAKLKELEQNWQPPQIR